MPGTSGHPDARDASSGMWYQGISFNTNGTSSPLASTFRGDGIQSVARTGVGIFLVTLRQGFYFREEQYKAVDVEDIAVPIGAFGTCGLPTGLGVSSGNVTFQVATFTAGGVLTDFGPGGSGIARRVSVQFGWKTTVSGL